MNKNNNSKAIDTLSSCFIKILELCKTILPYDKSVQGRIIEILTNNFYKVQIDGVVYTIPSLTDMTFSMNETVWVTKMQNDEKNKVISGRRRK